MSEMFRRRPKFFPAKGKPRLSREIFFWLALAGLIPFIILVLPQYFFAENALVDKEKQALVQALEARVYQVEKWLDNVRQDLDFIAESTCAQGHSPHADIKEDPLYCPFQEAIIRSHHAYRAIRVYSPNGELLSRSGDGGACLSVPVDQRLAELRALQTDLYIAPDYCLENGATFVTVGKKARGNGLHDTTLILAILNLNQAVEGLFANPFQDSGKFCIISPEGQYLYPPNGDPRLHGSKSRHPQQFLAGPAKAVHEYYDASRELVLGACQRVPGTEWLLVKEMDKDIVIVPRLTLAKRTLLAGILTLGAIFYGSLLVARRLTRPLEELAVAADSISLGDTGGWRKVPGFPQREVEQLGQAFNDMQDRLLDSKKAMVKAASLAAIGEFSAKIVHDLRSPLSSINLALRSLAKSDLDAKDRERLDIAREQARRLMNMADGVLTYGKPLQLNLEFFSLGQLLDELVSALGAELAEKDLELLLPPGENLKIQLQGDRELLLQALTNLVMNAAQWSPPHAVIEIDSRLVAEAGREIMLTVADAGPGFPEKSLPKLFQPFFTTRKQGTGLGLANAKKIIDYHGGSISAANRPTGGAEVMVSLPIRTSSKDA
jgi:signal transduction histidine kinase